MNFNVTLPTTDMSLYLTDRCDDVVKDFYLQAYNDTEQKFLYSKDREIYHPEHIENIPADWFVITTINDVPVQGYICAHYDWMPADWFRHWTRLYNLTSYTEGPKWMEYRMTEHFLVAEAENVFQRRNWIYTQNVSKDSKINFNNWKAVNRRNKRIIDKASPFKGYSYPRICILNKTAQIVTYTTFNNEEPDISWLDEFAIDES